MESTIHASTSLSSSTSTRRGDINTEISSSTRLRPASLVLSVERSVSSDSRTIHCVANEKGADHADKAREGHDDPQTLTHAVDEDTESSTYHGRRRRAANTCSWSSISSSFSTSSSSTLSTVATPIAILPSNVAATSEFDTFAFLENDDDDDGHGNTDPTDDDKDELDEQTLHEQRHQRRWRRRVTKSLCRASSNGDAFLVQQILNDGRLRPFLNVNASDDERDGTTPLIYAACFGKANVVQILLDAGARADLQDKLGWTALMWATTNNHSAVVALLLESGASSDARTAQGRTVLDFVDTENEQMVHIIHRRESMPSTAQQGRARRRSSVLSTLEDTDFYYNSTAGGYHHFMVNESERRRVLMAAVEEQDADDGQSDTDTKDDENDLASCEASMHSVHKFVWDQCLPDQMFVFSEDNADHILDTAITNLTLPMKSRQEIWVPANVIFLCSRFAHYYSSRELLHDFLNAATVKMASVLKSHENDIHTLAFWIANLSQLLYYLKKDPGLVVATAEHQLHLSELISETYMLLIQDSECRIAKILEPAMLEYEPIDGFAQVDFADDWHRFFRRRLSRRSAPPPPPAASAATSAPSASPNDTQLPRTLCPQTITSLLSSILYVLQSYEVHPAIIIQGMAQLFHFLSCEIFNRILTHKRYMCRSKALKIRMNVSIVEEWAHEQTLPGNLTSYFSPLVQLLQLLQCVSQLNELMAFISTTKAFELLNPLQIKRCVLNYRYEVTEPRLPEEIEKYTMQIAQDTVRSMHKRQSSTSDPGDTRSVATHLSRPTSVSSLGSLIMSPLKDRKRLSLQNATPAPSGDAVSADADADSDDHGGVDHDSGHEWVVEKRDSKYMLPFSLPNTAAPASAMVHGLAGRAITQKEPMTETTPRKDEERGRRVSDAMYLELKQKMGAEREKTAREPRVIPTIPEEWMSRLDDTVDTKQ